MRVYFRVAVLAVLALSLGSFSAAMAADGSTGIVVVEATWGTADKKMDVTQKIQAMIDAAGATGVFTPGYKNLGDPAPKENKDLRITYTVDDRTFIKTFNRGEKPISVASLVPITPPPAGPPSDPMAWKPGAMPQEAILAENDYAKAKAASLKGVDRGKLADEKYPLTGLRIVRVVAGKDGANHGLLAGYLISVVDGIKNPNERDLVDVMEKNRPFDMTAYVVNAGSEDFSFAGGDIAIQTEPYAALPRLYWQKGPRNASWDDDMLTATQACLAYDLPLALTALKHAEDAGCDKNYVQAIRALAWGMTDHNEEALTVGLPMVKTAPAEFKPYFLWVLDYAAMASLHPKLAPDPLALTREGTEALETMIKDYEKVPQAERISRPAWAEAGARKTTDYSTKLEDVLLGYEGEETVSITSKQWLKNPSMLLDAPAGRLHLLQIGPKLDDLVFSAEFKLNSSVPETTMWRDTTTLELLSFDQTHGLQQVRIDVLSNGKVRRDLLFTSQKPWFADKKDHLLTLAKVGKRFEMCMDGQTVMEWFGELNSPSVGNFVVTGMSVNLVGLEWRKVEADNK